jgi:hypothetical protein
VLREKVTVYFLVASFEEDRLAPITTLGNVMRTTGDNNASEARHGKTIGQHRTSAAQSLSPPVAFLIARTIFDNELDVPGFEQDDLPFGKIGMVSPYSLILPCLTGKDAFDTDCALAADRSPPVGGKQDSASARGFRAAPALRRLKSNFAIGRPRVDGQPNETHPTMSKSGHDGAEGPFSRVILYLTNP